MGAWSLSRKSPAANAQNRARTRDWAAGQRRQAVVPGRLRRSGRGRLPTFLERFVMNSPHSNRRPRKSIRSTRLALQALEDRCTPATAVYAAVTQTLTVKAAEGDNIQVAHIAFQPSSYIQVSAGSMVFDSSVRAKPVRNLIVRFNGVDNGGLSLLAGLHLGGDVSVFGARNLQSLASSAEIGGNVTYTASVDANDALTFFSPTPVGGNTILE